MAAAAAAAAVAARAHFATAQAVLIDIITREAARVVDPAEDPNLTAFISAAYVSAQIPLTTKAPSSEQLNFTYMSTVMTPRFWVIVMRAALLRRREDVLLGAHGAEIPGPELIQLKTMFMSPYTKINDWVIERVQILLEQVVDLARRIEVLMHLSPKDLFVHLRYSLNRLEKDMIALKVDQLHKEVSQAVGVKYANLKRHRLEEFGWGEGPIVKALGNQKET